MYRDASRLLLSLLLLFVYFLALPSLLFQFFFEFFPWVLLISEYAKMQLQFKGRNNTRTGTIIVCTRMRTSLLALIQLYRIAEQSQIAVRTLRRYSLSMNSAFNSTTKGNNANHTLKFIYYLQKLCWTANATVARVPILALQAYFMRTPWLWPAYTGFNQFLLAPCFVLPRMQLPKLATCQPPGPPLAMSHANVHVHHMHAAMVQQYELIFCLIYCAQCQKMYKSSR